MVRRFLTLVTLFGLGLAVLYLSAVVAALLHGRRYFPLEEVSA